jgi:hypothetical protein
MICNVIILHPLWKDCVAILDASGMNDAILDSPKGKSEVGAKRIKEQSV